MAKTDGKPAGVKPADNVKPAHNVKPANSDNWVVRGYEAQDVKKPVKRSQNS